jgi:hypothetical protein
MNDEDYFHLDPRRMGFQIVGTVAPSDQTTLLQSFQLLKDQMGKRWDEQIAAKEIFWLNVWQQAEGGQTVDIPDPSTASALEVWCKATLAQYAEPGAIMDGYGFVVNPSGSKQHQVWHIDYATDCAAIWVPLTPFTHKNATQFISLPHEAPKEVLTQVASDVDEVDLDLLEQAVSHLTIKQIAAQPMSILHMGRGTIHRGIPNSGRDDRLAFYISMHFIRDYSKYPYGEVALVEPEVVVFG